jgi:ribosomal protein S6
MAEMSQTSGEAEVSSQANAPKDSRPLYEIGFHVVPTVDESKLGQVMADLRAEIAKAGGEIVSGTEPAKMTLAYVIERATSGKREKYTEAYFGWVRFVIEERAGIPAIEGFLRQDRNFLRYLLIETSHEEAAAPRRAVFSSNRLEGETIKKPAPAPEASAMEISEDELNKGIDALVN